MALIDDLVTFDPDFAGPSEWAALYRRHGLQVVPAHSPDPRNPAFQWKRPRLPDWKQLQEDIVPELTFARWYGKDGEHASRAQMGILTGHCSGNVGVVDLDTHSKPAAALWWRGLLDTHNNGIEPETCEQTTGGGGRQLLFVFPSDFVIPTIKTSLGVDIRGQGGFAVMPPSLHDSGSSYSWVEGRAPYEIDIEQAPPWLCEAVMAVWNEYGTGGALTRGERPPSTGDDFDAFGHRTDGREEYMTRLIWAAVVDWHRSCPIHPGADESTARMRETYQTYERSVQARSQGPETKSALLEREGRGHSLFQDKWRRAMGKWETDVAQAAAVPRLVNEPAAQPTGHETPPQPQQPGRFVFETTTELRSLPPTSWLVDSWIPEQSTGIFYGKWGAGKSFIGFDLALHLAYGMEDWHGAALPEGGCEVLIIAREGHHGFVKRIDAFRQHYGIAEDPERLTFMRGAVSFMNPQDFADLCQGIRDTGKKFGLVITDTVARVTAGEDTNEQKVATLFMERCQALGEVTGAASIGVHHQNKAGTMMGSIYFEANADFVFEVSRLGEDGPLEAGELRCTKMKDGEDGWSRSVAYEKVVTSDITGEGSLIVKSISDVGVAKASTEKSSALPDRDACNRILRFIDAEWKRNLPVSIAPNSSPKRRARVVIAKQFSLKEETVGRLLHEWVDNGVIRQGPTRVPHDNMNGLEVIQWID